MVALSESPLSEASESGGQPVFFVREFAASRALDVADTVAGGLLALGSFGATVMLPPGSVARVALTAPTLLVLPGYLLLAAAHSPRAARPSRTFSFLFSLGVSPALVAVAALATALVPGGFTASAIVAAVTLACVALAGVATARRLIASKRA